jgi:hypothetical protein
MNNPRICGWGKVAQRWSDRASLLPVVAASMHPGLGLSTRTIGQQQLVRWLWQNDLP